MARACIYTTHATQTYARACTHMTHTETLARTNTSGQTHFRLQFCETCEPLPSTFLPTSGLRSSDPGFRRSGRGKPHWHHLKHLYILLWKKEGGWKKRRKKEKKNIWCDYNIAQCPIAAKIQALGAHCIARGPKVHHRLRASVGKNLEISEVACRRWGKSEIKIIWSRPGLVVLHIESALT